LSRDALWARIRGVECSDRPCVPLPDDSSLIPSSHAADRLWYVRNEENAMIARLVTTQVPPDRLAGGLAQGRDAVAEVLKMDGCTGHYLLADRKTGKVVSLSLWESEDKLRASEAALNRKAESAIGKWCRLG
jgi:heme-degrading monooxygenase HmoA